MWYVVQVTGGQELSSPEHVSRLIGGGPIQDAFVPQRETMRHRSGDWVRIKEVLFPGYLFIITRDPEAVASCLAQLPMFMRVLGGEGGFTPLSDSETTFISGLCGKERVAVMSTGVIEGDRVRVLSGPLCGQEATIMKIDRHKRAAYVRVPMLGRDIDVKLGLEIVGKTA